MSVAIKTPTEATGRPVFAVRPDDYRFLQQYIYKESGIVIDNDKGYLLDSRLTPILRREGLGTIEDLCNLLRGIDGLKVKRQVVEAMTTNETLFFRELSQYEALESTVLPGLARRKAAFRSMSFWSAAASTGQEAYSLAILLLEMGLGDWTLNIVGTDLNETVLDRARQGKFLQIEVNRGLPAKYLVKYFKKEGLDWRIDERLRRMVNFRRYDLRDSTRGMGPFDIVFCRNVLIYFDQATKRQILEGIKRTLSPAGYLMLGGAETLVNLDVGMTRVEFGSAVAYQAG